MTAFAGLVSVTLTDCPVAPSRTARRPLDSAWTVWNVRSAASTVPVVVPASASYSVYGVVAPRAASAVSLATTTLSTRTSLPV